VNQAKKRSRMQTNNYLAMLCLFLAALIPHSAQALGEDKIVHFPRAYSIGVLSSKPLHEGTKYRIPVGPAQGDITFKKGAHIELDGNHHLALHPEIFDTLPPDCLESLRMSFSSFDDAEDGLCDKALTHVGHLSGLKSLVLDRSEVTDAGLINIKKLPNLEVLSLFSTLVDGSSFKEFTNLKKLETIKMAHNALKPANYAYLALFPKLDTLNLTRCHPNDEAMASLGKCRAIRELHLGGNQTINDTNIKNLASMKGLHYIDLSGTRVTVRGLSSLKGLPIRVLKLPGTPSHNDLVATQQLFPGCKLGLKTGPKEDLGEDSSIFEPMH